MKKNHNVFVLLITGWAMLLIGAVTSHAGEMTYEDLGQEEKKVIDTIIDEFQRHYLIFKPELSTDVHTLYAATSISEDQIVEKSSTADGGKHGNPDGNAEEKSYKDAHLAARVISATPDAGGEFHTPIITAIPGKVYTYSGLYTVHLDDNLITVDASKAEKGVPGRIAMEPDRKFVGSLAKRLNGKVTEKGIVLP